MRILQMPRIPELVFAAVLLWLFAGGQGRTVLLADGDTGWHIRNGERILTSGAVPHGDPFGFGSENHPWFAWEWLSDVILALAFRWGGLNAVATFCGLVIGAYLAVLFRHLIWRSAGVLVALLVTFLTAGASSVHYLARPHVLGLLFLAITAWMIDHERAIAGRMVWWLPVLFLLWANCHGSFLAGLAVLVLYAAEPPFAMRRVILLFASAAGTLVNPYGWLLHWHAVGYLQSDWIRNVVEEFQSPRFRSEGMLHYEILLIAGVLAVPGLARRRDWYGCGLVLLWAHASLVSVRHVPLYCACSAPLIAGWLQGSLDSFRAGPGLRPLMELNWQWRRWCAGVTLWPVAVCLCVMLQSREAGGAGFPDNKFPVRLVERNIGRIGGRVLSSDQWSDYLIFRAYPRVRVFFDGRSDFFGPWRGEEYQKLMAGSPESLAILERERVDLALVPAEWGLGALLKMSGRWRELDRDSQGVLFRRPDEFSAPPPNQNSAFLR